MTRGDLHTSAVFAVAIGAVLLWFGTKMFSRPVETTQQIRYFVRRDRPTPKWARPHPDAVRLAARTVGAMLIALGLGLLVLGAYEWWWLSRT
jgi:threonine/homoserine/homoserine lactone efflux protein